MKALKIIIFVILGIATAMATVKFLSLFEVAIFSPYTLIMDCIFVAAAGFLFWVFTDDVFFSFKVINRTVQKFLEGLQNILRKIRS